MDETEVLNRIAAFLDRIGIPMKYAGITGESFVPGIQLQEGTIVVDKEQLKWPGDILHEAGHIAVMETEHRQLASGDLRLKDTDRDGEELGAIAWSYAASLEAGVPPQLVFHAGGYKDQGDWILEQFMEGNYMYLPLLQWMGLCRIKPSHEGEEVYPKMIKWIR
jgi:hypothetical protein